MDLPKTIRKQPTNSRGRKWPALKSGPMMTPRTITRKVCTLPIQEMELTELFGTSEVP